MLDVFVPNNDPAKSCWDVFVPKNDRSFLGNRAGMYLYRKMTGHPTPKGVFKIWYKSEHEYGTNENRFLCSNTVRRSAVAALGGSNPSSGAVSRGPQCKAAQTADQLSDFSTSRDESVRKFPKRKPHKIGVITLGTDLRLCDQQDFTVCCKAHLLIAGMRRLARNQVLI